MHAAQTIEELRDPTRALRHAVPEPWHAFAALYAAAMAPGTLDARTKELIALAIATAKGCDGCMAHHAKGAARAGATQEQVAEMLAVVLLMDGGPATTHAPRAFAAFLDFVAAEIADGSAADGG